MKRLPLVLLLLAIMTPNTHAQWVDLFDGKTLDGWKLTNAPQFTRTGVGTTTPLGTHSMCNSTGSSKSTIIGITSALVGLDKGTLSVGDLLLVGEEGRPVNDDKAEPSAETTLHVKLAQRGAGSVLHTHSVWGTLLHARDGLGKSGTAGWVKVW